MTDIRPVVPAQKQETNNWRRRFVAAKHKVQITAMKVAAYTIIHKSLRLVLLQMAGAFSVLYGISFYSVPSALIVGGLAAILVAERQ